MPVYFFWGEDDYQLGQTVKALREQALDPAWASFNYNKLAGEEADAAIAALNQAMTPPFGTGKRFVWLTNTSVGQRCSEALLVEFSRTLPQIPDTSLFVMSSRQKPDGRAKFTKLVQKYGEIREFGTIPPWKADQILGSVDAMAQQRGLSLTPEAVQLLAEAVGNQTRQLALELEKLSLYWGDRPDPMDADTVLQLVTVTTQTSLKLAAALRQGQTETALGLITDLVNRNEPALRIVSTLVGQFRLWLWVKTLVESGERDSQAIARAAEIRNPKRVYFLQKEVSSLTSSALQTVMEYLLELEAALKTGQDEIASLQTTAVKITHLLKPTQSARSR